MSGSSEGAKKMHALRASHCRPSGRSCAADNAQNTHQTRGIIDHPLINIYVAKIKPTTQVTQEIKTKHQLAWYCNGAGDYISYREAPKKSVSLSQARFCLVWYTWLADTCERESPELYLTSSVPNLSLSVGAHYCWLSAFRVSISFTFGFSILLLA